jgi:peptidoglycan/LPS O-acetylase OafA/YrhL
MIPPTPHLSHPKYRPDIDGLRAVAVLSVVAFHAFPAWVKGGFIGVDVFFVISGFLISTIIFENLEKGTFSFSEFYARRIKRIFPALLLVLMASFAFGWFALLADEYKQLGKHIVAGAGFVSNLVLWSEAGYFDNSAETKPLLHLWSLGIEEQFYIVWPFILWLAWKRKFNLLALTAIVALVSFALNLNGVKQHSVATFYSPQTRFWELLSGSILAWFALHKRHSFSICKLRIDVWLSRVIYRETVGVNGRTLPNLISLAGSLLLVYGFWQISSEVNFPGVWAVIPVFGAILIIVAGPAAWINRIVLSNRLAVWFGLISFPLYLWHWPLLSFARIVEGEVPNRNIRIAAVLLSVALAWLTFRLVERPIRLARHGTAMLAALVLFMGGAGFVGYHTFKGNGFSFRHQSQNENISQLSYEFPSSALCMKKRPYVRSCYESAIKHKKTILLIGDSHMEALTSGFKNLFDNDRIDFNVLSISSPGCPYFLNTDRVNPGGDLEGCKSIFSRIIDEAVNRQDIEWIVVAGRHTVRFEGTGFGQAEEHAFGQDRSYRYDSNGVVSSINHEVFELGLSDTLDAVLGAKKKLLFVHQLPELGFDPRICLRSFAFSRPKDCVVDKSAVLTRQGPYRESVANVLRDRPDVFQVDPMDLVCDNTFCSPFNISGELMYRDDDHMSKLAADYLAAEILGVVNANSGD